MSENLNCSYSQLTTKGEGEKKSWTNGKITLSMTFSLLDKPPTLFMMKTFYDRGYSVLCEKFQSLELLI